jgi:DNA-binding NarL/FixJ family response regulator
MEKIKISVLVVSPPGISQQMLGQTFCCRDDVDFKGIADGGLSALKMIRRSLPQMLVINSDLPESEAAELIREIRDQDTRPLIILLVETSGHLPRAAQAHPDLIVRSYELPARLHALFREARTRWHGLNHTGVLLDDRSGAEEE